MYFPSLGVIDPDGAGDDDDIEASRHSSISKKKPTRLSDVEVGVQDLEEPEETSALTQNKKPASTISSTFAFGRSSNTTRNSEDKPIPPPVTSLPRPSADLPPAVISERPPSLEGWLEKKQNGKMGQWQKRFFIFLFIVIIIHFIILLFNYFIVLLFYFYRYFRVLENSNTLAYYKTDK